MKTPVRYIKMLTICLISIFAINESCQAQFLRKSETFTSDDDQLNVEYIEVPDSLSLVDLSRRLTARNYPIVILQEQIFTPGIAAVKNIETQVILYQLRDQRWAALDSVNTQKIEKYQVIAELQEERAENFESANEKLNAQILQLNQQLTDSMELTEKSLRGRQTRNMFIGILGGAVGFSLAVLLGAN